MKEKSGYLISKPNSLLQMVLDLIDEPSVIIEQPIKVKACNGCNKCPKGGVKCKLQIF